VTKFKSEGRTHRNFENALPFVASLYLASFGLTFFLSSYFSFSSSEAISFHVSDGWCDNVNLMGVGRHCFGDLYHSFNFANLDNPYSGPFHPYPPLSIALFKPFIYLNSIFPGTHLALGLYLLLPVLLTVWVIYSQFRETVLTAQNKVLLVLLVFCSGPYLTALDRGNSIIFVLPLLLLFYQAALEKSWRRSLIYGLILVMFRPHFILFGLIFFKKKDIGKALKFAIFSVAALLGSFVLFPIGIIGNIKAWLTASSQFQSYAGDASILPVNMSLSNFAYLMQKLLDFLISGNLASHQIPTNFRTASMVFIIILGASAIYLRNLPTFHSLVVVTIMVILAPGTSFHYYLILLIVPILILLKDQSQDFSDSRKETSYFPIESGVELFPERKKVFLLGAVASAALLVPWALPYSLFGFGDGNPSYQISAHWLIGQALLILLYFVLILGRRVSQKVSS